MEGEKGERPTEESPLVGDGYSHLEKTRTSGGKVVVVTLLSIKPVFSSF